MRHVVELHLTDEQEHMLRALARQRACLEMDVVRELVHGHLDALAGLRDRMWNETADGFTALARRPSTTREGTMA